MNEITNFWENCPQKTKAEIIDLPHLAKNAPTSISGGMNWLKYY